MKHAALVSFSAIVLMGCAGQRVFEEGRALLDSGQTEAGLARVREAIDLEPSNREYRIFLQRQRDIVLQRNLALAENARLQGQYDAAEGFYRQMLALEERNSRALAGIEGLKAERRHRALLFEAGDLVKRNDHAGAHEKVRAVLAENGNHREAQQFLRRIEEHSIRAAVASAQTSAAMQRRVTLEFRDASIRQVFDVISRTAGLNFVFDRDVRADLRTTIQVRDTAIEEALRFILVTNQLASKMLNPGTILVYPNTQAKQRDYQETVVRTFYLANADVKQTANMLRTVVKTKDLFIDEKLNLIVMRDTADAVQLAERLVANQDLADPEVMLEVEVLEVGANELLELGVRYPDQFSYGLVGAAGTAGTVTLPEWLGRGAGLVRLTVTNPFFALNLRNQLGRTNLLANPKIRVRNKDKAKVHIGDKVPVITTTSTATGFVSESVNYLDVGLKLDVEPTVHLDDEVGIKMGLEVSSIVREIRSATGTLTYQVGTRNASTTLRLKDGETQMLAGLISDEDRKSVNQVPGLGGIPILGRLFGSHTDTTNKTEIVLLVTPRVVRNLARPEIRFEKFPGGTEAAIGAAPLLLQSAPLAAAPQGAAALPNQPASASPAADGRIALSGPASAIPGQEFSVQVSIESANALRSGLVDIAFDGARLRFVRAESRGWLAEGTAAPTFRANAPQGLGRVNLSFSAASPLTARGEMARLVFQALDAATGAPYVRMEALSMIDAAGRVVSAQLPAPYSLTLGKAN
jgi:general secretion pathway protein D